MTAELILMTSNGVRLSQIVTDTGRLPNTTEGHDLNYKIHKPLKLGAYQDTFTVYLEQAKDIFCDLGMVSKEAVNAELQNKIHIRLDDKLKTKQVI